MLKSDHCLEEHCCLGLEADNLCCWYSNELATIEFSLLCPGSKSTTQMSLLNLMFYK